MRLAPLLLVAIAVSTAASAQTATLRAPAWRASIGAGITANSDDRFGRSGDYRSGTLSLGVERRVWGPLALGVRGAAHTDLTFETDIAEPSRLRWTTEALASGTFRVAPRVDLRATVGFGAASLSVPAADPFFSVDPDQRQFRARTTETFGAVGVGADVYLLPGVGVGGEVRLVSSLGEPTASEASVGLRIRLPR